VGTSFLCGKTGRRQMDGMEREWAEWSGGCLRRWDDGVSVDAYAYVRPAARPTKQQLVQSTQPAAFLPPKPKVGLTGLPFSLEVLLSSFFQFHLVVKLVRILLDSQNSNFNYLIIKPSKYPVHKSFHTILVMSDVVSSSTFIFAVKFGKQ